MSGIKLNYMIYQIKRQSMEYTANTYIDCQKYKLLSQVQPINGLCSCIFGNIFYIIQTVVRTQCKKIQKIVQLFVVFPMHIFAVYLLYSVYRGLLKRSRLQYSRVCHANFEGRTLKALNVSVFHLNRIPTLRFLL